MTAIAACALPDTKDAATSPIQKLADLASCAMRMARRAVEQYEAVTAQKSETTQKPETTGPRKQPDPGTLFTRAARIVLDCITKESRLAAGLPLAPVPCLRPAPRIDLPASESSPRNHFAAEPVRQALRAATRNHPHGEKLLRAGLEHLESALAVTPDQPIEIPDLFLRICAAAGIRLDPAQCRKLARDPVFATLPAKPPAPA